MRLCHTLLLVSMLVPLAALAQEDEEGAKDHPDIPRFPGFAIHRAEQQEFTGFDFTINEGSDTKNKEGRYWHFDYLLKDGAKQPGAVEITRNYENAAKKKGAKVLYRYNDGATAHVTVSIPQGNSERWLQVMATGSGVNYSLDIVDVKAMEQKVELSASEMLEALNTKGFVALHGIFFDTGKDTIKPASEPLLKEIVALLVQNTDLKLSVEGHTDNVGNAKSNKTLSEKRAASVRSYLSGKGVAATRLSTTGWGDSRPVADNRTEEGRAQNRRVELVKK